MQAPSIPPRPEDLPESLSRKSILLDDNPACQDDVFDARWPHLRFVVRPVVTDRFGVEHADVRYAPRSEPTPAGEVELRRRRRCHLPDCLGPGHDAELPDVPTK